MKNGVYMDFAQFKQIRKDKNKKNYAVIGNPVGHSMSPLLHSVLSGNCNYIAVHVLPEELGEFCIAAAEKLDGFNITVPYKKDIIRYLHSADAVSRELGGVNTVLCKGGRLYGYNTDVYGITEALNSQGVKAGGRNALVLGAGGAASAAVYALKGQGANVTVAARNTEKAKQEFKDINIIDINGVSGGYDIVINCTPCGMKGRESETAVSINGIKDCMFIYDAVYNPLITKLIKEGREAGIRAENGLSMLVYQGARAQAVWGNEVTVQDGIYKILKAEIVGQRLEAKGKKCIALCGFMGCGKTAAARYISENYGLKHTDTDSAIEKASGLTVKEIFKTQGEERFRHMESSAVKETDFNATAVISLGGGAVTVPQNVGVIKENCLLVYIDTPLDECLKRAKGDSRPLLNADKDNIAALYEKRKAVYENVCDIKITARNTPQETGDEIIYNI